MYRGIIAFLLLFYFNNFAYAEAPLDNNQEVKACGGDNLLPTLSSEQKAKLAKKVATVPNNKGVFWKIEKEGIAPSWLLGTIHATDERVVDFIIPIKPHLEKADRVVVEIAEIQDKAAMAKATNEVMFKHQDLMNYKDGKTFKKEIPKEFKEEIAAVLKNYNLSEDQLFAMKPWVVYLSTAYPECEKQRIQAGLPVLDDEIAIIAKNNLIPVRGLETLEEQFLSLATVPDEVQFELIAKSAKTNQSSLDLFATMIDIYLSEDIGTTLKMNTVFKEYEISEKSDNIINDALIIKRNHRMADRMVPMIELGNSFFAVGAAHLPDEEGIIELLRQKGFTITRVALSE